MDTSIYELLKQIGLSFTQAQIFLTLYQYGPKPASSVAKIIGGERTNIYKIIQTLIRQGLVAELSKQGVKQFYIPDKRVLRNRIQQHKNTIEKQESILPIIETTLSTYDQERISPIPKLRFFEGKSGINQLFDDMLSIIHKHQYSMIKCIASNTIKSQSYTHKQLYHYAKDFFDKLLQENIHIESYLGNGIHTLEQILKTYDQTILHALPAGDDAVNLFIVGDTLYMILFRSIPFGLKMESGPFADMMHFLLRQIPA